MAEAMPGSGNWSSVHWGYGPGLAVCLRCRALVLPDDTIDHDQWHDTLAIDPLSGLFTSKHNDGADGR